MAKFKESELTENLKEFQNQTTVELEFERSIEGNLKLEETTIKYDSQKGFINIESKDSILKINTALVYGYEKVKGNLYIDLESILLKIKN